MQKILFLILMIYCQISFAQPVFQIARLKYSGGGDWYNDPSSEVNLLNFVKSNTNIRVKAEYKFVDVSNDEIYSYPFLFLTGHGNITFSNSEIEIGRAHV